MSNKQQYLILCVTAAIALLSSIWAFWSQGGGKAQKPRHGNNPMVESVAVSAMLLERHLDSIPTTPMAWKEPEMRPGEGEWRYDVFTPPRIFIHPETGEFEPRAYQFAQKQARPHLEFVAASRPLFRYQLSGYVEHPSGLAERAVVLIEDTVTRANLRVRLSDGGSLEGGYTLESFFIERRESEGGAIQRIAFAGIREPGGSLVVLQGGVPATTSGLLVRMRWQGEEIIFTEKQPSQTADGHTITWHVQNREEHSLHFSIMSTEGSETIPVVFAINPDLSL